MRDEVYIPIVPRPPTFILPKRAKGTEQVVMVRGTTSRITITFSGLDGISFEVILIARKYYEYKMKGRAPAWRSTLMLTRWTLKLQNNDAMHTRGEARVGFKLLAHVRGQFLVYINARKAAALQFDTIPSLVVRPLDPRSFVVRCAWSSRAGERAEAVPLAAHCVVSNRPGHQHLRHP